MKITTPKLFEERPRDGGAEAFQDRVARIGGVGAWDLDVSSHEVMLSRGALRLFEGDPSGGHRESERVFASCAQPLIEHALEASRRGGRTWDFERPCVTAKGRSIHVRNAGEVEFQAGQAVRLFGVFQDVTARHLSDMRAREEARQYRLLAENTTDMIVRIAMDRTRVFVSPACEDLIGFKPDELVGTRPRDAIHPDDAPSLDAMIERLVSGAKDRDSITNRLRHKQGHWIWVEATWRVLRDERGRPTGFIAAVRDIGARRAAEERLQTSETLYRTLADSLPQMVWIVRATDRTALYANRPFYDYYGPIGDARDERIDRHHPDDSEGMEEVWTAARREGRKFETEGRLRRFDGQYRWHKVIATPIFRAGEIVEWLGTALDIDEIVTARQKLREASDLLSLSQEAAGAGFFDINLLTGGVILSRESAAMHGLDDTGPVEIDIATWKTRVDAEDAVRVLRRVDEACLARQIYSAEFRVLLAEGGVRWIHGMGRAHYDAAGRAVRMIGLNFDVTDRKMAETKLIAATNAADAARRDAEKASDAKSEFLASMSHEIRTPLNSIIGYTELLLDKERGGTSGRRWLELIQESSSALLTVVNDILDFSRIEAGQIKLDHISFPLETLIQNVLSMVAGFAGKTGLAIEHALPASMPRFVVGDPNRLRQVLLNLLNNAVKFTPAGTVRLVVTAEESRAGTCRLRFTITDTGIGIARARQAALFQRFSQGDGSITRRFGGTGLGLAISKSLVELMHGAIGVESAEGQGSSFWFTVELSIGSQDVEAITNEPEVSDETAPLRVLLVEDVEINQELARLVLEARGHHVEAVSDGAEAIRSVQAGDFDVVLMDVQMPGMDGLTATRHIRALEHPCRDIPIIAMTANVLPRQISAFKAAGMNDHVGKPFKRQDLYETLARWAPRPRRPREASASTFDQGAMDDFREMVGSPTFDRLFVKFQAELGSRFGSLLDPVDPDRLARDAHAMIAVSASFGFKGLADLCREVEETCRVPGDLSLAIRRLDAERGAVLRRLEALARE